MFSEADIIAKAWLTIEIVNLVLVKDNLSVDKIYLIGSYANGTQTHRSDLDFLIQLKGGRPGQFYVPWSTTLEIQQQLGNRIHVIFGTKEAAERLHQKHKNEFKNYQYREISQGRIQNARPRGSTLPQ